MTHTFHLLSEDDRPTLHRWVDRLPVGWKAQFRERTRTDEQNKRFWELLGRVSLLMDLNGQKFAPDQWKAIHMEAQGHKLQYLPSLSGSWFPTGFRSSKLTVREMADLQTAIEAWCAERGVDIWGDDQ